MTAARVAQTRGKLGRNVFDMAIDRMAEVYEQGHRIVVSTSGGKDSTCALEVCVLAAEMTGRLPVEAVHRDEEVCLPGTVEYLERLHERPEVDLHWLVAHQAQINVFDRHNPYWWTFDPELPPDRWVREPPPYAEIIPEINIQMMCPQSRFPTDEANGQKLIQVVGLRVEEARGRMYGIFSAGGHHIKRNPKSGAYGIRPIYDWTDADVWRAIKINGWDYNSAYDVLQRYGLPKHRLRIGPPSMNVHAVEQIRVASQAWPRWFDDVIVRLPGMKSAAQFGARVVEPIRRHGESWEATFWRECVDRAPEWIADRSRLAAERIQSMHRRHSTAPIPEVTVCRTCQGSMGSWRALAKVMYTGDPFSVKATMLPYVEPEFFRPGSGRWGGTPG